MSRKNGLLDPAAPSEDDEREASLRPLWLAEFIGQSKIKDNLGLFIKAARDREEALDHAFLIGPPGLGKTTLSGIMARELGVEFRVTSAPALDKPKDLAGILTTLGERAVFFIDEIHRLKPVIEEMLYIAMEDFELDWVIGQGPQARTIRIPLPRFTLVGATTKAGMVSSPLSSRFGMSFRLEFYSQGELEVIVDRTAGILEVGIESEAVSLVARASRGTPRVANRVMRRMRDFAQVLGDGRVTRAVVEEGLSRLDIDGSGLERFDREILRTIIERYAGGPVGADTLSISLGESLETLEDYYEPFLIQQGFLQRTPRGRVATRLAYGHLGLPGGKKDADGGLFV